MQSGPYEEECDKLRGFPTVSKFFADHHTEADDVEAEEDPLCVTSASIVCHPKESERREQKLAKLQSPAKPCRGRDSYLGRSVETAYGQPEAPDFTTV